jgi:hypothetical protein
MEENISDDVHYEHSSGVGSFLSDEELAETRA